MKIDRDFWRRLKLYLIGFGIGMLIVSVLFKGRTVCKMPGTIKREELYSQDIVFTGHGLCRMKCRDISTADVAAVLVRGSINYGKSEPQDKPCGTYAVEGETADKRQLRIVFADCDTISKLVTAIDLGMEKEEEGCDCK